MSFWSVAFCFSDTLPLFFGSVRNCVLLRIAINLPLFIVTILLCPSQPSVYLLPKFPCSSTLVWVAIFRFYMLARKNMFLCLTWHAEVKDNRNCSTARLSVCVFVWMNSIHLRAAVFSQYALQHPPSSVSEGIHSQTSNKPPPLRSSAHESQHNDNWLELHISPLYLITSQMSFKHSVALS